MSKKIVLAVDGFFAVCLNYYLKDHYKEFGCLDATALKQLARFLAAQSFGIDQSEVELASSIWAQGVQVGTAIGTGEKCMVLSPFQQIVENHYTTIFMPMTTVDGKTLEKGVDVALALSAHEALKDPEADMLVLATCDGDFIQLAKQTLQKHHKKFLLVSCTGTYKNQNREFTLTCSPLYDKVQGLESFCFARDFPNLLESNEEFCRGLFYIPQK